MKGKTNKIKKDGIMPPNLYNFNTRVHDLLVFKVTIFPVPLFQSCADAHHCEKVRSLTPPPSPPKKNEGLSISQSIGI